MEEMVRRTSANRFASSTRGWLVLAPHAPGAELFERLQRLDSVVTLKVEPPLRLVEAIALRAKVKALIAHRPSAIVLDVDGLLPIDEMGVLMLPTVAREAAGEGTAVVLANPSRALHDRLLQLGVRDLTFVDRARRRPPRTRAKPEADRHDETLRSSRQGSAGRRSSGEASDGHATNRWGRHEEQKA